MRKKETSWKKLNCKKKKENKEKFHPYILQKEKKKIIQISDCSVRDVREEVNPSDANFNSNWRGGQPERTKPIKRTNIPHRLNKQKNSRNKRGTERERERRIVRRPVRYDVLR